MTRHWLFLGLCLIWTTLARAQDALPKPLAPQVELEVARNAAPGPKIRLSLNTRNVPTVRLSAVRLDPQAWFLIRDPQKRAAIRPIAAPNALGTITMAAPSATTKPDPRRIDRYESRQVNLPPLVPGVYQLAVEGGGARATAVVNITNLAIVVKRAPQSALVWVTDHRSGRVIPGARVRLLGVGGQPRGTAVTGSDGVARIRLKPGQETVLVETQTDVAGVEAGTEDPDGKLVAHVSTDRPIYRPGQQLHWKAILRLTQGAAYTPVAGQRVTVEVRDSRESVLEKKTLTTTPFGTVSGEVELPSELALGPASIVLTLDSGKQSAYTSFTVAAYRKPEFTVSIKPEQARYFAGERARFTLDARYFFGAAVPSATIQYQIRRTTLLPESDSSEQERWFAGGDGNLYPADTYQSDPFITEGETQTDAKGIAQIAFSTTKDTPDSSYSVTATLTDGQKRQVTASASVPVYAAALRLGLKVTEYSVAQGTTFPVHVQARDLDGKAVSTTVTVVAEHEVWDEKQKRSVWRKVAEAQVRTPATTRLPAQVSGSLRLTARARDSAGRVALAQTSLWVASPHYKPDRIREPEVTVRLDRKLYKPGEQARAFVTTNTPSRPILVTLEGGDVFSWTVLPAGKTGHVWAITTTPALSPNVTVEATQWAAPARFVSGSALLAVPDPTRQLTVTLTPNKRTYEPGEQATATLRLTDQSGKPVRGEVAVGVVDAAIYALRPETTPALFPHFWGLRSSRVGTFQSAPEEVSGGAYQRANGESAPLRQRFVDTAFWGAHLVTTAADGTATVAFVVPGNLTTWRWTARAVTETTQVGETTTETIATRPVTLRLAVPRQAVVGDAWTLVGTVNNRTEQEKTLTVTLTGFPPQTLTVAAKGEARAQWEVSVPRWTPEGSVTFEASVADAAGLVLDRLRQSVGLLPKSVPQRFVSGKFVSGTQTIALPELGAPESGPRHVVVEARSGLTGTLREALRDVLASPPHDPDEAADTLLAVAAAKGVAGVAVPANTVRDARLLLTRMQRSDGTWGCWETAPPDAHVTAKVLCALARTPDSAKLLLSAQSGAAQLYTQLDHWERRALLAAALRDSGAKAAPELEEVARRGINLSPYARLRLRNTKELPLLGGPERARVPVGTHPGWRTTTVETSAEALFCSSFSSSERARLARGLAYPEESAGRTWRTRSESAAVALGLAHYLAEHPERPHSLSPITVSVNGGSPQPLDAKGRLSLPLDAAQNTLTIQSSDEVFVTVATTYPAPPDPLAAPALLRRLATPTAEGLWTETGEAATLRAGQTLRLTLLAWPEENAEVLKVEQQLPAGFELVDEESDPGVFTEVRDNRLVHRFVNTGRPVLIRVYLRPESVGQFSLTPALLEDAIAPNTPRQSAAARLTVLP